MISENEALITHCGYATLNGLPLSYLDADCRRSSDHQPFCSQCLGATPKQYPGDKGLWLSKQGTIFYQPPITAAWGKDGQAER